MQVSCKLEWNKKTKSKLDQFPDEMLHIVAKQTYDLSQQTIPMSNTKGHSGTLRRSSRIGKDFDGWYVGSFTNYAIYVWKMEGANWTTPGTNNQWFLRTLKKNKDLIIRNAINQSWRE